MTYQSIDCGGCAPPVQASTEGNGMSDIPEEIMKEAEATLDRVLCNCKEAGDVRHDSIMDIARALLSAEARGMERAAKIAKGWSNIDWVEGRGGPYEHGYETACGDIVGAIRNGTEASDA